MNILYFLTRCRKNWEGDPCNLRQRGKAKLEAELKLKGWSPRSPKFSIFCSGDRKKRGRKQCGCLVGKENYVLKWGW